MSLLAGDLGLFHSNSGFVSMLGFQFAHQNGWKSSRTLAQCQGDWNIELSKVFQVIAGRERGYSYDNTALVNKMKKDSKMVSLLILSWFPVSTQRSPYDLKKWSVINQVFLLVYYFVKCFAYSNCHLFNYRKNEMQFDGISQIKSQTQLHLK